MGTPLISFLSDPYSYAVDLRIIQTYLLLTPSFPWTKWGPLDYGLAM